jgi:hypothetical protein
MEEYIYKGDLVNDYIVLQASPKHWHLVNKKDFNRWSDCGIEYRIDKVSNESYITREDIERMYPFEFKGFKLVRKNDWQNNKQTTKAECNHNVSQIEIERIIAHSICNTRDGEHQGLVIAKIAKSILSFLSEKGI